MSQPDPSGTPAPRRWPLMTLIVVAVVTAVVTAAIAWLLVTVFEHKEEQKHLYIIPVPVTEDDTDPKKWGENWPKEYDGYRKTVEPSRTNFGGGDAPATAEKAERSPWLTRMFAGYAFSLDYRDRRGHAYMLLDQEKTRRVTERPQPGSCLHCHGSVMPLYRQVGGGDAMKGFEEVGKMTYKDARAKLEEVGAHPVSCVDCHQPNTMELRVTRPGFIRGITALKEHEWKQSHPDQPFPGYDVNKDATRQEMRSFVCGQCHVEYYCGPKTTLFFPWNNGLKVEEIESYYDSYKFSDGHRFYDWAHAETGTEILKAQHPEFELWNQGIHARRGVACADCHMPYERVGATKISDHWVRSPLTNINRACQTCHHQEEAELQKTVAIIQNRNFALMQRAGGALIDMLNAVKAIRAPMDKQLAEEMLPWLKAQNASAEDMAKKLKAAQDEQWSKFVSGNAALQSVQALQRKAQWRLDFIAAENSMGFHAPQEAARILGESIDYSRQAQVAASNWRGLPATRPATLP